MSKKRWIRHRPLFASPLPAKKPPLHERILPVVWSVIGKTCTFIGAFVLIIVLFAWLSFSGGSEEAAQSLPSKMVLYIDFQSGFDEQPAAPGLLDSYYYATPTVHEIADSIDAAAKDDRVQGIVARMEDGEFPSAQSMEVRAALKRFEAAKKFTKIYSSSYGESAGGLGRFYLASAFQERWMQPLGTVSIMGVNAEMPFFKGTLDKIGVKAEFFKRKKFKTAFDNFMETKMSDPARQEMTEIVGDVRSQMVKDISADLKITPAKFEALVAKGMYTAPEALQEKLITNSDYVDVLMDKVTEQITGKPDSDEDVFVDPLTYLADVGQSQQAEAGIFHSDFISGKSKVALIYVTGLIMDTASEGGSVPIPGMTDEGVAAADEIAPALLDAADDDSVQAVVVRINSPGGSPVASETILRAIQKVKDKGKPVVISMGEVAASGGYWVATNADRIFAEPTTLTGSVGVLGGKFSGAELSKKLGVTWDGVTWGQNAGFWDINNGFSPTQAERMNASLDEVYRAFIARVAEGRNMKPEDVEQIAQGHVWTGMRAVNNGLVDELGGLPDALDYTAKVIGLKDRSKLDVEILPKPQTPIEELLQTLQDRGMVYESFKAQAALGKFLKPVMEEMAVTGHGRVSAYSPVRVR